MNVYANLSVFRNASDQQMDGGVQQITWTYPIRAFPEVKPPTGVPPVEVRCQARMRMEERLEVLLAGLVPSSAGLKRGAKPKPSTGSLDKPETPEKVVIGECKFRLSVYTHLTCGITFTMY